MLGTVNIILHQGTDSNCPQYPGAFWEGSGLPRLVPVGLWGGALVLKKSGLEPTFFVAHTGHSNLPQPKERDLLQGLYSTTLTT